MKKCRNSRDPRSGAVMPAKDGGLPVGVFAVFDGVDAESFGMLFSEADTVVANAETLLALFVFQGLDAASAGLASFGRKLCAG